MKQLFEVKSIVTNVHKARLLIYYLHFDSYYTVFGFDYSNATSTYSNLNFNNT